MSQYITIQSLVTSTHPYISPNVIQPIQGKSNAPVQLTSADNHVWLYDGELVDIYFASTGVDDNQEVIVSTDSAKNVQWSINPVPGCGQHGSATSYPANIVDVSSNLFWTVSDPSHDNSPIVVQAQSDHCDYNQLFLISF